jgi:hypothetical protein
VGEFLVGVVLGGGVVDVVGVVVVAEGVLAFAELEMLFRLTLEVPQLVLKLEFLTRRVPLVKLVVLLLHAIQLYRPAGTQTRTLCHFAEDRI